ncbi:MAG: efflux RND transporter periplasmic adaptor subunit [Mariniphaga sp.]
MNKNLYLSVLICVFGFNACNSKKTEKENVEKPILVETQTISKISTNKTISVSGNIEGNKTVKLGFLVAGKIDFIAINEGEPIGAGKLLASIDPESYAIAKDMADATVEQAQDEYNRLKEMYERKSISESDYVKISCGLKQAKAQQRLHTINFNDTKLVSPINGILLKRMTEVGEIIGVGIPFFVIADIQTVKVNASVPESDLNQIKTGGAAEVYISALDTTFAGKISEIGSVAEATSRAFTVKIELKNPKLLIRPGMTAEVKFSSVRKTEIIVAPAGSILHDADNSAFVYIADMHGNRAIKRKIAIGQISGDNIEIVSGIETGEKLIIGGQNKVSNGSLISIK